MSSATLDVLLDCASVGHGTAVCQEMQSDAPHPLSWAPDETCPLLNSNTSADVPTEVPAVAQWQLVCSQPVHLCLAALLALNAALMLCVLRRMGRHAATPAGIAVAAAAEACSPIDPAGFVKPLNADDEPCNSRFAGIHCPLRLAACVSSWQANPVLLFCTEEAWSAALVRALHAAGACQHQSPQHHQSFFELHQQPHSAASIGRHDPSPSLCTSVTLHSAPWRSINSLSEACMRDRCMQ